MSKMHVVSWSEDHEITVDAVNQAEALLKALWAAGHGLSEQVGDETLKAIKYLKVEEPKDGQASA